MYNVLLQINSKSAFDLKIEFNTLNTLGVINVSKFYKSIINAFAGHFLDANNNEAITSAFVEIN